MGNALLQQKIVLKYPLALIRESELFVVYNRHMGIIDEKLCLQE